MKGVDVFKVMDARVAPADDRSLPALLRPLKDLSSAAAAQALVASCDIAVVVDPDGIVSDVTVGTSELANQGIEAWVGHPWADSVHDENRVKIAELLAGARESGRWRQVNHPLRSGELPVRYLAIDAGNGGGIVAVGRDMRAAAALQQRLLRAQQSMERDSLRLRQLEARFRLLFDSAAEPIIIIDATTRRITEANPAARALTGLNGGSLDGQNFANLVADENRDTVVALLGAVAAADQRSPARVHLAAGPHCQLSATLFRQDRGNFLLIRLRPLETDAASGAERSLGEVLERLPDAFVLTDDSLSILATNAAFLDLAQQPRREALRGTSLSRFLGRPGIDLGLLVTQLREHGIVRNFGTIVRASDGHEEEVEVSAVTSIEGGEHRHGFSLRVVSRRVATPIEDRQMPRSVEQLTELVGRVSLKEIVRESTDLIERLCIEAALTYTSDNRASAAEILGLSRQSLYSKLHRHGLGNLVPDSD